MSESTKPRKKTAGKSRSKASTSPKKRADKKPKLTARNADKHVLYQLAVQAPELDAKIYSRWFKRYTGRDLRVLREDFCGTAVLACHHVKRHPDNVAIGVDLDGPTLDWGREHNVARLLDQEQQQRLTLLQENVLDVQAPKADAILALNFSYSVFNTREQLGAYLKNCYRSLKPGGVLYLDSWGGPDVLKKKTDKRRVKGFQYHWEQRLYDPISHRIVCAIHFAFPDGTKLKDAFVYDWRLWTLAELRELFVEAGFEDTHVLWEGTDPKNGGGNGKFTRKEKGDMDECWITFVVGRKPGAPRRSK
ncbi:MAG: class I SAM-dependent methyltransferase [Planctomycetes bacterium]|nr:class I SAM-dependent methyltransferase [Planctomycetota bacterium]